MVFLRRLAWLLLPVFVLLLILAQGREDYQPHLDLENPETGSVTWEAPQRQTLDLVVQRSDGEAAVHAIVMSSAPNLAVGRADDLGHVQLQLPAPALPAMLMVYAPGHHVLTIEQGEASRPEPVRLRALSKLKATQDAPRKVLARRLEVHDQKGTKLTGTLVMARERALPNAEPWLAFVGADGIAWLPDVGPGELQLEFYAPSLPPHRRNRLGQRTLSAGLAESRLTLDVAYLQVIGSAGTMLRWEHAADRDLLPMARLPEAGSLRLGPVPPGPYRMQVGAQEYLLQLLAGDNQLQLSPAQR